MLAPLVNIFRIPELRSKVIITLALLVVCRVGVYVPIPGVDTVAVSKWIDAAEGKAANPTDAGSRMIGLVDMFTGGALVRCTVFALGVMPYISASIIFQLLTTVVKPLEELQKEGEAGRKKINQYTRYATVLLCVVQGLFIARYVTTMHVEANVTQSFVPNPNFVYYLSAVFSITAGTMFLMWIGEQITEFGIGNGMSLIIMAGIIARIPSAISELSMKFVPYLSSNQEGKYGLLMAGLLILMYVAVVVGVVIIQQAQRQITVQQAKHTRGRRVYGGQRHYMPLRVNQAGVIPIIFAQSLLMFPPMIFSFIGGYVKSPSLSYFIMQLGNQFQGGFLYVMLYVAMIFFFCFFWTAVVFNPIKMADDMKQYGHFIPGIRPGTRTADYLEKLMTRITLAGAAFLAAIAILPLVINRGLALGSGAAQLYGGTGLLIVVGVALDMVQKIESHLLMRHYGGFLKGARVRGRSK
ncbi:MAG TPA: preprotein translocase subunit SecY [Planctomycetota bacterium]|nr:preprotein translocase subunit SecY [Planctomycetota bacterium]